MSGKTLSLGIVISASGFGGATNALGSVSARIAEMGSAVDKAKSRIQALGTETTNVFSKQKQDVTEMGDVLKQFGTIDAFAKQKQAVVEMREALEKYRTESTDMGRRLAVSRKFQDESTKALTAYREEMAGKTGEATDAQKLKLKLLREQAEAADKDVRELSRQFEESRKRARGMSESVDQQSAALQRLRDKLHGAGISTNNLAEHRRSITRAMEQEKAVLERLTARYERFIAVSQAHLNNRTDLNSRMGDVASAYAIGKSLEAPVKAFVTQEDAVNGLKVAMMKAGGTVGPDFDKIKRQAVELGNVLPGTTADYINVATALLELGTAQDKVAGGALKAAANLRVVLGMGGYEAGALVSKVREAYNLSDNELATMADKMQRAKFAFGMQPQDLRVAASYEAAQLNTLRLGGEKNMEKMLALQGMANLKGMDASQFGTNFSMMLSMLVKGPLMIEEAKKGMKAEARDLMEKAGLTQNYFDKKTGQFIGIDAMVAELGKLNVLRGPDGKNDEALLTVTQALFGQEGGRPAAILAGMGVDGFQKAMASYQQQASLQERIDEKLKSTRNNWEALTGSVENFAAAAAGPAVEATKPLIGWLNDAAGAMTTLAESNPRAAKWIGVTVGVVAAATVGFLSLGVALSFARFALTGAQLIPGVMTLGSWLGRLGGVLKGPLLTGLRLAGNALLWIGRALFTNPIGLAITAIAVGAFLIYKYWGPISTWFGSMWGKTKAVFSAAWTWFTALPATWAKLGSDMVDGLLNGIKSKAAALGTAVAGLATSAKDRFAGLLGIKSPSRVFMGFGQNIGEGAEQGVMRSLPGVRGAAGRLAGVVRSAASSDGLWNDVRQANRSLQSTAGAPGTAAGQAMVVHFSPVIHLSGGQDLKGQMTQAVDAGFEAFEAHMRRYEAGRRRVSFAS